MGLFWSKRHKFQISAQSDVRFSRYDTPIFRDFAQNGCTRENENDHISVTTRPIVLKFVLLDS